MQINVVGDPPWFDNLAEVMDPAHSMLDELATDFAPAAEPLDPDVSWTAFHCYVLDRLVADAFDPAFVVSEEWIRQAAWVSYATGFWCTRSWRGVWIGLDESFSVATTADSVQTLAGEVASKLPALREGGSAAVACVAEQLRTSTFHGAVYGTAYNTSYLIVVGEEPPLGQRPPHLSIEPGFVRADAEHLLGLEYKAHMPAYLTTSRSAYDRAAAEAPDAFRSVLDGRAGETSLADLWRDGFELAPQNWGSDFIVAMTQSYYDPFVRWSALYNFGLEAIARNAIVALALDDADLACRALAGNTIFDGSWASLVLGVVDGSAPLPELVTS